MKTQEQDIFLRVKEVKSKERMSGECREGKVEKTSENIKRDFLDYLSKFSALNGNLDVKSCNLKHNQDFYYFHKARERKSTTRRMADKQQQQREARKIYGKMKSFRSRTLINITFPSPLFFFFFLLLLFLTCSTVFRSSLSRFSLLLSFDFFGGLLNLRLLRIIFL